MKIVTLLTDFGYNDHYVAAMKGVILSICPDAQIIDVSHGVPSFDIISASYVLKAAYKYFPEKTVHVVVVDPGVGTSRKAIAIETKRYFFVGPDNGVLIPAAMDDGISRVVEISGKYMQRQVSCTFHGRDIFAPAAAYIACGVRLEEIGKVLHSYVVPEFVEPEFIDEKVRAKIIYIDKFGNAATNVSNELVKRIGLKYGDKVKVEIKGRTVVLPFLPSFGYVGGGEGLLLINSEGYLELAVNLGSAAEKYGLNTGDEVLIYV